MRTLSGEPVTPASAANNAAVLRQAQARGVEDEQARERTIAWRPTIRRRVLVAAALLACWTVGIETRLLWLQILEHDDLMARAERQRVRTIRIPAKRGDMVDRNGRVFAYSVDGDAVYAEPVLLADRDGATRQVCAAIDGCTEAERQKMLERLGDKRSFAYLWRKASPADAQRVRALHIRGVGVLKEDRRYYPNKELAAHVVGYVGLDNTGLGGVEAAFDDQISGSPGMVLLQTDAKQNAFARVQRPATVGATLELTIDSYLQFVAERELAAGVAEFGARAGCVVIMDPRTGDVYAIANYPTFNPNVFQGVHEDQRRNRAVQEVYEPGSTFKMVTASAAVEEHLVDPDDKFDVSSGSIRFGARTISDTHRNGVLSFTDIIVKSSNVGAIKVGMKLGAERLGRYVRRFGFGQTALGQLPGETRGIVWKPEGWSDSALASVSMGYQIGVTPIQMATAASAIANGGELVPPRIVRAVIRDHRRAELPPRPGRRIISPATAETLTGIMEQVVERGTAKAARMEGFSIAGKTGTAAKLENGHYSKSDYNASFIGFLPSRAPALTILVVIDSPHGKGYFGGSVAAPIFKRIAEQAVPHLGLRSTIDETPRVLVAQNRDETKAITPTVISAQMAAPAAIAPAAADGAMPDLRGMSARQAVRRLAGLGAVVRLRGDGLVVGQDVAPGLRVEPGTRCLLHLARYSVTAPSTTP